MLRFVLSGIDATGGRVNGEKLKFNQHRCELYRYLYKIGFMTLSLIEEIIIKQNSYANFGGIM
jgi:hypothetical protein